MPKIEKPRVVDNLRHAEYYDLQSKFDELYQQSSNNEIFDNLMDLILSRENILLAYRNIKANKGSQTPGTDKRTMKDISNLSDEQVVNNVRYYLVGSKHGYRPKPVRRKEIPKPNGKTRPLGIPCIWDRLIQQCIKQVLEPICEAKFSNNSYGFRPNRCVEHAIAETHRLLQKSHMHYVVEFDIKGFFDNVNHVKLIRQIWALGIHDKQLIFIIKRILKAPIQLPNGKTIYPEKGTPQGGIISPLLANIVLNELDHWVDNQWLQNPVIGKFKCPYNKAGTLIKSNAYLHMRKTNLKEIYIIRYADDFRIFCRTKNQAEKIKIAVINWLRERLKLEVSEEKTRIINARNKYVEFLGFKIKLREKKKNSWIVKSHICDKKNQIVSDNLKQQIKKLPNAKDKFHATSIIRRYNTMVMGIQNYYKIATEICKDLRIIQYEIGIILNGRLHGTHKRRGKLSKKGRQLSEFEQKRYGLSKALRYYKGSGEPIYPIGYVTPSPPISKNKRVCSYTSEGRKGIHANLKMDTSLLIELMKQPVKSSSLEYNDNRISLYSAQNGKCSVTQRVFHNTEEIHCHHKLPRKVGGDDKYANLTLVLEDVHRLIHATKEETINKYLDILKLTEPQLKKLNKLRIKAGLNAI